MGNGVNQETGNTANAAPPTENEQPSGAASPTNPPTWHPDEKEHRRKERGYWNWSLILTSAAVGGAITSAVFAWGAVGEARRQANAAYIANRAYVTSTAFQLINYGKKINGHLQWTLRPIIENTGNTSPRGLQMKESILGGVGPQWSFDSIKKSRYMPGVIPPHSVILGSTFGFSVGLPQIMMPAIAAGIIKYRDIFGESHLTEYCFTFLSYEPIDFDNYPAGQPIRVSGMIFDPQCIKHNCDDEDCGADWKERAEAPSD
jgi:hypothetical protein